MLQGMTAHAIQGFDFNRNGPNLQVGIGPVNLVYECADGYVVMSPLGETLLKLVTWCVEDGLAPEEWLEEEDWAVFHVKLLQGEPTAHTLDEVLEPIRRYLHDKTKSRLLEQSMKEGVSMAPVSNVEELARFRHLEERGYWLHAPLPNGREAPVPGVFARSSTTPLNVRRWPPRLGEHNSEVLGGLLGLDSGSIARAQGDSRG
jgi:crotonobetainyl-CoA:carnitine CoA-transferase CaiB-like acyl-CoA transferase